MNDERRNDARADTGGLSLVAYDALSGDLVGSVANISPGGIMLIGRSHPDTGGILQLSLQQGAELGGAGLDLAVRITWVKAADTPGNHWIGGQFLEAGPAELAAIQGLVDAALNAARGGG